MRNIRIRTCTCFNIDVRTPGKNFDEFYRRAVEDYGVHYIKGMVGKVVPENGKLKVQASDLLENASFILTRIWWCWGMITRWCRLTAGERPCCLKGKAKGSIAGLPDDNPINQGFLLSAGLGQVDFRGLNAFMAQKVSQQGDIVKFCQEILAYRWRKEWG